MKYGLYDTKGKCWLGNAEGPLTYDKKPVARAAARIIDIRLRWPAGRTRAMPYTEDATILKDEMTPELSAEEAMDRLDQGLEL